MDVLTYLYYIGPATVVACPDTQLQRVTPARCSSYRLVSLLKVLRGCASAKTEEEKE